MAGGEELAGKLIVAGVVPTMSSGIGGDLEYAPQILA